ncbi:MAG TPA: radical SAM protein [Elusimicrobiales bacterium]|nr:radical SAM protein [Elusimicrobiales bacterium]
MKITLAIVPGINKEIPVGVPSLAAFLRSRGHEVAAVDLNIEFDLESRKFWARRKEVIAGEDVKKADRKFADGVAQANPAVIAAMAERLLTALPGSALLGFSVWNQNVALSLTLAAYIRKNYKSPFLVLGGHAAKNYIGRPEAGVIDAIVTQEGENALLGLVDLLPGKRGAPPAGTVLRRGAKWVAGGPTEEIQDLDALPFPDYTGFPLDKYPQKGLFPLTFNRGCIGACSFCSVHNFWGKLRHRSGASLYAEYAQAITKYKAVNFEAGCSAFNLHMPSVEDFCDRVIAGGQKAVWGGLALMRRELDEKMARKLARAGCNRVSFGLESGSDRMLGLMRKSFNSATAEKVVRACFSAGIRVGCIVMTGFPGETPEDLAATKRFLTRNKKYIFGIGPSPVYHVEPGSAIGRDPARYGINAATARKNPHKWESLDGKSTHASRTKTAEEFTRWVLDSGIRIIT